MHTKLLMKINEEENEGLRHPRIQSEVLISGGETESNSSEVKSVSCESCGISEDCTATYIGRIKELFCGKWICGLCSEAVEERMKRAGPEKEEALVAHMALCQQFNRTTRVNPELSLAGTMRDIARKSSKSRDSRRFVSSKNAISSGSCGPALNVLMKGPPVKS